MAAGAVIFSIEPRSLLLLTEPPASQDVLLLLCESQARHYVMCMTGVGVQVLCLVHSSQTTPYLPRIGSIAEGTDDDHLTLDSSNLVWDFCISYLQGKKIFSASKKISPRSNSGCGERRAIWIGRFASGSGMKILVQPETAMTPLPPSTKGCIAYSIGMATAIWPRCF